LPAVRAAVAVVLLLGIAVACRSPQPRTVVVSCAATTVSLEPDSVNEEFARSIHSNLYEPLVDFDAKLTEQPGLAESWYAENDLTWVFRLREGVRFHDGRLFVAADAAASLQRARDDPAHHGSGGAAGKVETCAVRWCQAVWRRCSRRISSRARSASSPAVVMPMVARVSPIGAWSLGRVTPAAGASMLVATARSTLPVAVPVRSLLCSCGVRVLPAPTARAGPRLPVLRVVLR
jgi:peptide/nickel transport system substrate-binding protein